MALAPQHRPGRSARRRALELAALVGLAACFVLPSAPFVLTPGLLSASSPHVGVVRVAPAYAPAAGIRLVGPLPSATQVQVVAALAPRDLAGMEAQLAGVTTPGSPEYGHYLSAPAIASEFAPTMATYSAAASYFTDRGLTVTASPDRWALTVSGPASSVGPAFGTVFDSYVGPSGAFIEHPTPATLPASTPWSGVLGLGTETGMRPLLAPGTSRASAVPPAASCSASSPLAPCDVDSAYNVSGILSSGDNGTGYSIGVVDVYDAGEPQHQLANDVSSFTSAFKIPLGTINYLYPVPTTNNLNQTYTQWGGEEALDLEWTRAMAPGATIDMTFAPDPTVGLYSSVDWLVANQAVNVISLSWGEPDTGEFNGYAGACASACNATSDGSYTILHPVMVAAALEGIGVFAASGDCGAAFGTNGVATSYPASDPAVVGVGATNLALSGITYSSESAWSGNDSGRSYPGCQNQGGSGGGYSPFPRPAWQDAPGFPVNGTVRGVPDVSIIGGSPGVTIYVGGYPSAVEGTSVSCPIWAGLAAVADQVHGSALGFLGPSLYAIARSSNASKYFHDITTGSNGYRAGKGWDPVTGIGSPNAGNLLPALGSNPGSPTALFVNVLASPRSGNAPLAVQFSSITYNASSSLYGFDVDFGDGNSTWSANGTATHTYQTAGVYLARSIAFLQDGNSSVSPPIAIVVGGGALNVSLAPSTASPAIGQPVTLNVTVLGGTAPYRYSYAFGDGTYLSNTNRSSVVHDYAFAGDFCPVVVAWDSNSPPSGGASPRVALDVGGVVAASCQSAGAVSATISASATIADLPGNISFRVAAAGGAPPYSVRLVSDDPYVTACSCGLFSSPGNHTVTAFVNDSQSGSTNVSMNVTLFPAIHAAFSASPLVGTGSLVVGFSAAASGGYGASAANTNWSFGDGVSSVATGATASHTYAGPGVYVANATLRDAANGRATETFLIDVLPSSTPGALAVSASVSPAGEMPSGTGITFAATATGGTAPYTYHWDLGPAASAYGPVATESYPTGFSGALDIYLNVTDSAGTTFRAVIPLSPAVGERGTALTLTDSVTPTNGATPLVVSGTASVSGMPLENVTWSFGTGAPEYGTAPAPEDYLTPGNYTLTVTATDPFGDRIVHSSAITVSGVARTLPTISGGPASLEGIAPFAAMFNVTAAGGAGAPYVISWDFGDGNVGAGSPIDHTYTTAGIYTATVTVTDAIGTPASTSYDLIVYNLTSVYVGASPPLTALEPNATFNVSFVTVPLCGGGSVPNCAAGPPSLLVSLAGSPTNWTAALNASGEGVLELKAGAAAGSYEYEAAATGQGFAGQAYFTVNVTSPPPVVHPLPPPPPPPPFWEYAAVGAFVVVAVIAVAALLVRRRPGSRTPPATP